MNLTEWVGYLAAGLVVMSFLVSSNVRVIRTINFFGAVTFIVYGFMLDRNLPIIIPNVFIALIQLYWLFIKKKKDK